MLEGAFGDSGVYCGWLDWIKMSLRGGRDVLGGRRASLGFK